MNKQQWCYVIMVEDPSIINIDNNNITIKIEPYKSGTKPAALADGMVWTVRQYPSYDILLCYCFKVECIPLNRIYKWIEGWSVTYKWDI